MTSSSRTKAVDRHALVMALWLPAGLVASVFFHYGVGRGGAPFILSAFGVVAAAFVGHVIANAVHETEFTARELALGLVLYLLALLAFGLALILDHDFARRGVLPTTSGFLLLFVGFVFYLVTRRGVRSAFEAFDVVRTFKAEPGEGRGGASR